VKAYRTTAVNIRSLGGFEIVDNDEDVVHPFKRHVLPSLASLLMPVLAARAV
jgi:hypothetical protein